jgi:hypothetical protein
MTTLVAMIVVCVIIWASFKVTSTEVFKKFFSGMFYKVFRLFFKITDKLGDIIWNFFNLILKVIDRIR